MPKTVKEGTLLMMLHAIGYDTSDVKRGKYLYYRNYYGTSPGNADKWEYLADIGYAQRDGDTRIFYLTAKGLDFLEGVLGIKIHDGHVSKYKALNVFIDAALNAGNYDSVLNVVSVAKKLRISRYRAKELIDLLRLDGLLELHCVYYDDARDKRLSPPYWGYGITEKVKMTEQYKAQAEKYKKSLDVF